MIKLIGGTLVLALTSLVWAAPQASSPTASSANQTTKQHAKKSGSHAKHHSKKSHTTAQPAHQ